jgi:hypothetical protein
MSWTYSADPTSSKKDAIRWLVGDTNIDSPLIQDEEIAFCLAEFGGEIYRAASTVAQSIAAFYTGEAQSTSKSVGGLSLSKSFGDKAQRYQRLSKDLLARSRRVHPPMVNADSNALGAEFTIGKFDPYYAIPNDWPSESALGVSTTYGTGYNPQSGGEAGGGQDSM